MPSTSHCPPQPPAPAFVHWLFLWLDIFVWLEYLLRSFQWGSFYCTSFPHRTTGHCSLRNLHFLLDLTTLEFRNVNLSESRTMYNIVTETNPEAQSTPGVCLEVKSQADMNWSLDFAAHYLYEHGQATQTLSDSLPPLWMGITIVASF